MQTIGDLQAKSESELKAIPNFGERSIEEVIEAMHGSASIFAPSNGTEPAETERNVRCATRRHYTS